MERKTIELILPESKAKVVLYEFLTGGDFRAIQKKLLGSTNISLQDVKAPNDISGAALMDADDFTAKILIKSIAIGDGPEEVTDVDKFVYNLSIIDSNTLFEKVREISNASNLSSEAKKK